MQIREEMGDIIWCPTDLFFPIFWKKFEPPRVHYLGIEVKHPSFSGVHHLGKIFNFKIYTLNPHFNFDEFPPSFVSCTVVRGICFWGHRDRGEWKLKRFFLEWTMRKIILTNRKRPTKLSYIGRGSCNSLCQTIWLPNKFWRPCLALILHDPRLTYEIFVGAFLSCCGSLSLCLPIFEPK